MICKEMMLQIWTSLMICVISFVGMGCTAQSINPDKKHHTRNGFRNLHLEENHGFFAFLRWRWERLWKNIPSVESYHFPVSMNDPAFLKENQDKITLTWIGHATLLLQIEGVNILTDPQFSDRASPVQWAGPKRVVPPGLLIEALPRIHIVVISHDHYDSLDTGSIIKLYQRTHGEETTFFVPLGLKKWFQSRGINNAIEMDWWDVYDFQELRVIAAPMQHWSKRNPFTRNNHLWASWIILSEHFRFYFGGDTGYSLHFKEIGEKYGPFDLTALPIGAYEPRWFMKNHHINPEEAVQAHKDIRSRKSVAMHWGTFMLTDEPLDEPPRKLKKAMKKQGIAEDEFLVLQHGETVILD